MSEYQKYIEVGYFEAAREKIQADNTISELEKLKLFYEVAISEADKKCAHKLLKKLRTQVSEKLYIYMKLRLDLLMEDRKQVTSSFEYLDKYDLNIQEKFILAKASNFIGQSAYANKILAEIAAFKYTSPKEQLLCGLSNFLIGKFQLSEKILENLHDLEVYSLALWSALPDIYFKTGKDLKCINLMDTALKYHPDNEDYFIKKMKSKRRMTGSSEVILEMKEYLIRFPEKEKTNNMLVSTYLEQNDIRNAEKHIRTASSRSMELDKKRLQLAYVKIAERNFDEVHPLLSQISDKSVHSQQRDYLLSYVCRITGDLEQAYDHIQRVLSRDCNTCEYRNFAGVIELEKGDINSAKRHFEIAMHLNELNPSPVVNVIPISDESERKILSNRLEKILTLSIEGKDMASATSCLFGLADIEDLNGDYASAWAYYIKANAHAENYKKFDSKAFYEKFEKIKSNQISLKTYTSTDDYDGQNLVFIVSIPRSGSTVIHNKIMEIYGAKSLGENALLTEFIWNLIDQKQISLEDLILLKKQYVDNCAAQTNTERLYVDKMPFNFLFIKYIRIMFPKATIIEASRSTGANAVSLFRKNFQSPLTEMFNSVDGILRFQSEYKKTMALWKKQKYLDYYKITTSDFIKFPEEILTKILDTPKLSSSFVDEKKNSYYVKTASVTQSRNALSEQRMNSFKHYEQYYDKTFN